ncbi:uncharacterized protein I206_100401 [Kwoniella pini CBS 10737]|uniref:Uncharacterized protein n=1 Tax=Kwoniella pini CBS 10737 TaxID=1296096 RepID=A0AAJ8MLW9_9TREE
MGHESRSLLSISNRISRSVAAHHGFINSIASSSSSTIDPSASRHVRYTSTSSSRSQIHSQNISSKPRQRFRKVQRQTVLKSLGSQADDDLVLDSAMARSLEIYRQRHRSGAPRLSIPLSTKNDLPQSKSLPHPKRRIAMMSTESRKPFSAQERSFPAASPGGDEPTGQVEPSLNDQEIEEILGDRPSTESASAETLSERQETGVISAKDVKLQEIKPAREMKIARLRRALGRVLFSPGVVPLRDTRTGVWNFDPTLHTIPQPDKFAFHRCPPYITPSQDEELVDLAQRHKCGFVGSTSTLTKALSQIYFAISGGKGIDLSTLSQDFSSERWDVENVISDFGRILEKMLTCENADFKRFLTSSPESAVPEEERSAKEAYRYQRVGSLLMRSQLDCYDPRLPGNGVFDIKTRACLPIRHDRANYVANAAYDIWKNRGISQSYEREYYDLLRAGMLKFSLQVRIGGMDGIFLAYHNTSRLFGFQYISLSEIDERIFGSTEMADQAFKLSVSILEQLLHHCVELFPDQAINVILKHSPTVHSHSVTAYVEPKEWDASKGERPVRAVTFTMENTLDDEATQGQVTFSVDQETRQKQNWSIKYNVSYDAKDEEGQKKSRAGLNRLQQNLLAMNSLTVPAGQTVKSMTQRDRIAQRKAATTQRDEQGSATTHPEELISNSARLNASPRIKWREAGPRQIQLREEAIESGRAYEQRKKMWKKNKFAWTV